MKTAGTKQFFLLILLMATIPSAMSAYLPFGRPSGDTIDMQILESNDDGITLSVAVPGIQAETIKTRGGVFTRLDFQEEEYKGAVGDPRIPVIRTWVEVPYGGDIELTSEVSAQGTLILPEAGYDYPLVPVQLPVPKIPGAEEKIPFQFNKSVYQKDEFLGGGSARIQDVDFLRGHRIAVIEITPVTYHPIKNEIQFVSSMLVHIRYTAPDWTLTEERAKRYFSLPYEQVMSQQVINHRSTRNFEFPPGAPICYLIISHTDYQNALTPFIEWKTQCGYDIHMATAASGATTTTIKNIIQNAYDTWSNPPDYVLLAGDTNTIPCYTGETSGSEDDNQYTELEGTGYYTPDVMIGRFPVRSVTDVENLLNKLLQFEEMTMSSTNYFKDSVWLASSDHSTMLEATHEYCFNTHVLPVDSANNTYYSVYERLGGTTTNFASNVNSGRGIVCYSGHGYGDGTGTASIHFVDSNVQALTNLDKYGNVLIFTCGTNLYNQTVSFGERWVLVNNKGSVSYWGTSNNSYWDEDDYQEREIYRCQHEDNIHTLSSMCMNGLIDVYNQGGAAAYYFDIYNLMGDPSTDFVTRIPQTISIVSADATTPNEQDFNVTVNVGGTGRAGALVAINMGGTLLSAGYTNSSGVASLHFTPTGPGTATIMITGHNLIPNSKTITVMAAGCGSVFLSDTIYTCTDTITMTLWDSDLNINPSVVNTATVDISSTTESTPETRTLTETGPNTSQFVGTIQGSPSQSGAGYLQLTHGDTITLHYHDAACEGSAVDVYDTSSTDCQGPVISNVQIINIGFDTATVTWDTSELSDSLVTYGLSVPPGTPESDSELVTDHSIVLTGLSSCTPYYLKVASSDVYGNTTEDTNSGSYYSFVTPGGTWLLDQNMNSNPGWTVSGGQWAWGQPTGGGGSNGDPDPTSGYTGTNVYGYNLSGDYANSMSQYFLTSAAVNCFGASDVVVSFWRWLGVEDASYDHAAFMVSNNGSSWTTVWQNSDAASMSDGAWVQCEYDISAIADNQSTVYLRWSMGTTDSSVVYCGWNIDDVKVFGLTACGTPTPTPTGPTRTPTMTPTITPTPAATYCAASGGCDEYISGVQVGTIINTGTGCSSYMDYTGSYSTNMTIGTGYTITVTIGNAYSSDLGGVWVDWNQDIDFSDSGEFFSLGTGVGPYTTTITPPAGASLGATRMRVRLNYSSGMDPCGTTTYGEVEDYTVVVVGSGPTITPTRTPTTVPSNTPTYTATRTPTVTPTSVPMTATPTRTPTSLPTSTATFLPTNTPTLIPTGTSTPVSTNTPTGQPTSTATNLPTNTPILTTTPTSIPGTPTSTPTPLPVPATGPLGLSILALALTVLMSLNRMVRRKN